jgi:hypothetical protein
MNIIADDPTIRAWINNRIREALDQADLAGALADDLDDHVLAAATRRLSEDLPQLALVAYPLTT